MTSVGAGLTRSAVDALARRQVSVATAALGVLLFAGAVAYYVAGRGLSFFYDEWTFILQRQANDVNAFLAPHNGHLSVVPVLIYKALWATAGLRHYGPYRLVDIALHLTCVSLLYVYVRRRVGDGVALVAAVSLLLLGRAWQDLIWPFQMGYLGSLAAGLGALLVLERHHRRGDAVAAFLLAVAVGCSGIGLSFIAGAAVALLVARSSWRRYWLVAAPLALYLAWYAHYGQDQARASNIPEVPSYVYASLAGALGALSGWGSSVGEILAGIALAGLILLAIARHPLRGIAAPATIVVSFWVLTALSRAQLHEPAASRYLYPGALLLLSIGAELGRGTRPRPGVLAMLWVLVGVASALNLNSLRHGAASLRATDGVVQAELAVIELEGTNVQSDFQPDPARAPQITAGPYLAVIRHLGSPTLRPSRLAEQAPEVRGIVDSVLVAGLEHVLVTRGTGARASSSVDVDGRGSGELVRRGGCLQFRPQPGRVSSSFDVVLTTGGLLVRTEAAISLFVRRFGDNFPSTTPLQLARGPLLVRPPRDASTVPWRVRIAPSRPVVVCAIR